MAARLHFVAAVSVCMEKKTDLFSSQHWLTMSCLARPPKKTFARSLRRHGLPCTLLTVRVHCT